MPRIIITQYDDKHVSLGLDNKTIGYIRFSNPKDSSGKRNIELEYVEIDEKYRGQGYGTKLIQAFMKDHKDCVWISLWTSEELERRKGGWKIYKRLGFKQLAYQADYYAPGIGVRLLAYKNKEKNDRPKKVC